VTAGRAQTTSARLAASLRTDPVVVRRITGQLARAGLIRIRRGPGGTGLAHPSAAITLAAVWPAMNPGDARPLLTLHAGAEDTETRRAHLVLAESFAAAETAFRLALGSITLAELAARMGPAAGTLT
jgi:DNA-binding IscR family transcriptional regulator